MNSTKISVQTVIAADSEAVWDCYTNPKHIIKWNFATDDWCCPWAENDLKIGGTYKARMEAKDGSFGFDFEAKYTELNAGKSFVYVMADGRQVSTSFSSLDDKTEVKTVFDAETENPIDMQRDGWEAILNNFKSYVENKQL